MNFTLTTNDLPLTELSVDTPRTRKRKADAVLLQSKEFLRTSNSGYALRCLNSSSKESIIAAPPTTDSPFRWAKRQAKKAAPVPMSQLAAPLSPSLVTAPTTTPTTSTTLELDAAGDSRATVEDIVIVLESTDIKPSTNVAVEHTQLITDLHSTSSWSKVYYSIESFRRLCLYHTTQISLDYNTLLPAICNSAKALRSAVARNSLLALNDAFAWTDRENQTNPIHKCSDEVLHLVLSTLLEQGAADKLFLRQTAEKTLNTICKLSSSAGKIFHAIAQHVDHKRTKIPGLVGQYSVLSLQSTTTMVEPILQMEMIRTFSKLLTAKDPRGRTGGKAGLLHLHQKLGRKVFVAIVKESVPTYEIKATMKAAGILPIKKAVKRVSLKEKMRMARLAMKQ